MKLRMLLDTKPVVRQPGRLIVHFLNELNLTNKATNGVLLKDIIAECLDELAEDGLITLVKRGNVYDEAHRTERQRAYRSDINVERKKPVTPEVPEVTAHQQPAVTFEPEIEKEVPPVMTTITEPQLPTVESEDEAGMEMLLALADSAEKFKKLYETEAEEHRKTKQCKETISAEKRRLEEELSQRDATIAKMKESASLLEAESGQLRTAVENGTKLIQSSATELEKAQALNERLSKELETVKRERSVSMSELAARVARITTAAHDVATSQ